MWTRSEVLPTLASNVPRTLLGSSIIVDPPGSGDYYHFINSLRVHNRNTLQSGARRSSIPKALVVSSFPSEGPVIRPLRVSLTPSVTAAGLAYDNLSTRGSLLQVKLRERVFQWLQRHGLADLETFLLLGLIVFDVLCNTIMLGLHRQVTHRFLIDIFGNEEVEQGPSDMFGLEQKIPIDNTFSTCSSMIIYGVIYLAQAFGLYGIFCQNSIFLDTFTIFCTLQSIFLVFCVLFMPLLAPVTFLRCCLLGLGLKHSLTLSDRNYHKNEEAMKVALEEHQRKIAQEEEEYNKKKANAAAEARVVLNDRLKIELPIGKMAATKSLMTLPGALLRSPSTSHPPISVNNALHTERQIILSSTSSLSSISEGSMALPIRAFIHESMSQP